MKGLSVERGRQLIKVGNEPVMIANDRRWAFKRGAVGAIGSAHGEGGFS